MSVFLSACPSRYVARHRKPRRCVYVLNLGGTGIRPPDNFSYRSNFRFRSSFRSRSRFCSRSNFRSRFSFSFRFSYRSSSSYTTSGDIFYCSGSRQLSHSSWYFLLRFPTKYRVALYNRLCAILLLFADASCLIQWRYRIFFFQGSNTERKVTVEIVVEVHPIPQPTRGSGERCKLWGLGQSQSRKRCLDVLCAILCHFSRVLVHFGRWLSGIITPKYKKMGLVKSRCMLAF